MAKCILINKNIEAYKLLTNTYSELLANIKKGCETIKEATSQYGKNHDIKALKDKYCSATNDKGDVNFVYLTIPPNETELFKSFFTNSTMYSKGIKNK